MSELVQLSNSLADLVSAASPSVVQVLGARSPVSGVVHGPDTILTIARAIGRDDRLRVRLPGSETAPLETELAGWDPATGLAVVRTPSSLELTTRPTAPDEPRPGEIVVAIARSWSNAVTASCGNVAVVGGPLRTGRRREIPRVFRMTASLHEGFAGGGIFDAAGRLAGVGTLSAIRGFAVGIPASIAWAAAARILEHGTPRRGYAGVAVKPVELPPSQQQGGRERALLVMGVSLGSPAEGAGLMVGDLIVDVEGHSTPAAEDFLDLLTIKGAGQEITVRLLRGGAERAVTITLAERPRR